MYNYALTSAQVAARNATIDFATRPGAEWGDGVDWNHRRSRRRGDETAPVATATLASLKVRDRGRSASALAFGSNFRFCFCVGHVC